VGKAFGRSLQHHGETVTRMKELMNVSELNEGQLRMALLPTPDQVYSTPDSWVPLVRVKNVLILPGVPRLFHSMIDNWFEQHLPLSGLKIEPKIRCLVKTYERESVLAKRLCEIQSQVTSEHIEIGSYPKMPAEGKSYVILSVVAPLALKSEANRITNLLKTEFNACSYEKE
jgi:molybdopterin-biosynthesis enzyme MoeA-like protein